MPPNEKKLRLRPPDVLSNLDNNLIDDILMRLPLRDAVRTSILSKKWRYIWRRLPQVKFDQTVWKTTEDLISPTIGFTRILYHLFAFPVGPITKLTLDILRLKACPNVDHLISFLYWNGIQHLVLKFPFSSEPYKLPYLFFTCSQLRHLFLMECEIHPPWFFKGFDRLISLKLKSVTISSESLESLISHCPLLENLELKDLDNSNLMKISSPKLRSFVFRGSIHFLHLENVPLLSNISYTHNEFSVEAEHDLADIFESIPAHEYLRWNQFMVVNGSAKVIPTRLPSALNCLKRLYISWINLGEFFELSFALCLIRSSSNLEEIEIKACVISDEDYFEPVPRDILDEIPASFSDMTFHHLRTVKFYDVIGAEAEMQLIRVLLAKSPALVKMVIKSRRMEAQKSLKVLAEIAKFQRASPKAEVVYNVDYYPYHNPA